MNFLKSILFLTVGASIAFGLFLGVMIWGAEFALPLMFLAISIAFGLCVKEAWESWRG